MRSSWMDAIISRCEGRWFAPVFFLRGDTLFVALILKIVAAILSGLREYLLFLAAVLAVTFLVSMVTVVIVRTRSPRAKLAGAKQS